MASTKRISADLSDYMRRIQRQMAVPTQDNMAALVGMAGRTYKERLRDPSRMTLRELWAIEQAGAITGIEMPEVRQFV